MRLSLENPLWDFSLVIYAEGGVREECLALQERLGLDVNLLLFCAYVGGIAGMTLAGDEFESAAALVAAWHGEVVRPLRAARRALKPFDDDAAGTLRASVKQDELAAEQIEQAMLWSWSRERLAGRAAGERSAALTANLARLLRRYGENADPAPAAPNLVRAVLRRAAKI